MKNPWTIHEISWKIFEIPIKIMKYPWKIHNKTWNNKQYNKNEVKENTELECHLWAKNIGDPSKRDEITALPTLVKGPRKWNQKKWLATIVGQSIWNQSKRDEKNHSWFWARKIGRPKEVELKNWLATIWAKIFGGPSKRGPKPSLPTLGKKNGRPK